MGKSNQLTEWMDPNEMIASGYGMIRYKRWCEIEIMRMVLEPDESAHIMKNKKTKRIAIFVKENNEL